MSSLISRRTRVAVGLAAVAAFAVVPVAAQAADTNATGTLTGGTLSHETPAISPFSATLTGLTQTVTTAVGAYSVTDPTGSNRGWDVTVSATAPTVSGGTAGTGSSLTLAATQAVAAAGNPASGAPVPASQVLGSTALSIQSAAANAGQGKWNVPEASAGLSVVIPGNASAGTYSSTLTYTSAQKAV